MEGEPAARCSHSVPSSYQTARGATCQKARLTMTTVAPVSLESRRRREGAGREVGVEVQRSEVGGDGLVVAPQTGRRDIADDSGDEIAGAGEGAGADNEEDEARLARGPAPRRGRRWPVVAMACRALGPARIAARRRCRGIPAVGGRLEIAGKEQKPGKGVKWRIRRYQRNLEIPQRANEGHRRRIERMIQHHAIHRRRGLQTGFFVCHQDWWVVVPYTGIVVEDRHERRMIPGARVVNGNTTEASPLRTRARSALEQAPPWSVNDLPSAVDGRFHCGRLAVRPVLRSTPPGGPDMAGGLRIPIYVQEGSAASPRDCILRDCSQFLRHW